MAYAVGYGISPMITRESIMRRLEKGDVLRWVSTDILNRKEEFGRVMYIGRTRLGDDGETLVVAMQQSGILKCREDKSNGCGYYTIS